MRRERDDSLGTIEYTATKRGKVVIPFLDNAVLI